MQISKAEKQYFRERGKQCCSTNFCFQLHTLIIHCPAEFAWMCSSVPEAFVQISAPARTLVLYQCNPNKVNHFTTTLYHPVTYWTSLPNCALNTLVTKHIPVVLWFDCGLWQCISQVFGLCNWSTMYILQLKIGGSVSVSISSVALYLYLQPTCPNAPSRQGRSLLASSAWGAHKLLDFGLHPPPPSPPNLSVKVGYVTIWESRRIFVTRNIRDRR